MPGDEDDDLLTLTKSYGASIESFKAAQTARLDDIEAKMNRCALGLTTGGTRNSNATVETKALATFIRNGGEAELKALSIGSDPDGGYLVTPALADTMIARAWDISPIGRLARRITIGAGDAYEEPIDVEDVGASWVGERTTRPETDTAQLGMLRIPVHEIYALQKVTQRLIDDARFDVGAWASMRMQEKFARSSGAAFVTGNGIAKPRGLLDYTTSASADGARDWFVIQHVNTGDASGFPARSGDANPADRLVDMVYSLRAPYRTDARWTMNRTTAGTIRKMKDGQGNFIWADAGAGMPASLFGYPVELDEEMPDIAAGTYPIAFGDFRQAYTIVEKPGLRLLRDPYSDKPHVLFYAYSRFGGGLANGEAVKLLRVAASG